MSRLQTQDGQNTPISPGDLTRRRLLGRFALLSLAGSTASTTLATPTTAQPADKQYFFDFANVLESGELFKEFGDGLVSAAEVAGVKVKRYNNNNDPQTSVNNARLMLQDKPDLILEYIGIEGIGGSIARMVEQAKVPLIAINVPIPGAYWFNLVNREIGTDTAKIVVPLAKAKGWTAADTTVIFVQGSQAGTEVNDCVRYFYVTAAKSMPGMEQIEPSAITPLTTRIGKSGIQVDGKGTLTDSYAAVKNTLQTLPADRHILLYTINDDSTLGSWRAVTESHREDNTLVAGLGGSVAALKELRTNPHWVAEGSIFTSHWGQYLIAMGVAIMQGVKPPSLTKTPQVILTKETVDKHYDATGKVKLLPPLVPENLYLKDTGLLQKFHNIEGLS
jgi:ribose transport system substrate-binding protein